MKKILMLIMIITWTTNIFAQEDAYVISQQRRVKILPVMQSYTLEDISISEFSIPLQLYFPLSRSMSFSLFTGQASASSDDYTNMSGLSDTQISCNYYFEKPGIVFNVGLNLPGGKKELSNEEFKTSTILSWDQLNFRIPGFGQGLNITPGITWALPAGDNFVFGLGAAYQYKGSYKSLKDMDDNYDPGDEILITGGFDIRFSETITFSSDLIYTIYGEDKIGDESVFASGDKLVGALLFNKSFGYHELRLFTRYRSKGKNMLASGGELVEEEKKTTPDQVEVIATFHWHNSRYLGTNIFMEWRSFQKTDAYDGLTAYGLGIGPQINFSKKYQIPFRFKYISGNYDSGASLNGLEAMAGLIIGF